MEPQPALPSSEFADPALGCEVSEELREVMASAETRSTKASGSRRSGTWVAGVLLAVVASVSLGQFPTDERYSLGTQAPTNKVILLRNGRVIEGEITRETDRWLIRIGTSSQVRMELDQIDLIGSDYHDIRRQMQARTQLDEVNKRVAIARFCIQHRMYAEAQEEIDWLIDDGLDARTKKSLLDHLQAARRSSSSQNSGSDVTSEVASQSERSSDAERDLDAPSSADSGESIENEPSATRTTVNVSNPVGQGDPIDAESFSVFVRRIQPVLVAGCAVARCHGPQGTTEFQLQRLELGAQPTKRMSENNYREVRRWALTAPEGSTLVDWSLRAHGGQRDATWLHAEAKADELRAWLEWMRQIEPVSNVASTPETDISDDVRPVSYDGDLTSDASPADTLRRPPSSSGDPYDPALFRRYMQWKTETGR